MNKFIGLVNAWNSLHFIEPVMKMAIEYCDEVMVAVGPHSYSMEKYEDGTTEIAERYRDNDKVTFVPVQFGGSHVKSKTPTLNLMLEKSKLFDVGNWVWLLDTDEFHFRDDVKRMKDGVAKTDCNAICITDEKCFFINMKYYLTNPDRRKIWKITDKSNKFLPLQKWTGPVDNVYYHEACVHHYTLLLDPHSKKEFWSTEYEGSGQDVKVRWIDEIYLPFELDNQEKWIEKNEKMFGRKTPFMQSDYGTDINGRLFEYDGKYPEHIQETELHKIEDFRKLYNDEI
jgi:hypothetical protein